MSSRQLPLPLYQLDDLTPFDRQLLDLIKANVDPRTGTACSLFDLAVRRGGMVRRYSGRSLRKLESLGFVEVHWPGRGFPLNMRPLV